MFKRLFIISILLVSCLKSVDAINWNKTDTIGISSSGSPVILALTVYGIKTYIDTPTYTFNKIDKIRNDPKIHYAVKVTEIVDLVKDKYKFKPFTPDQLDKAKRTIETWILEKTGGLFYEQVRCESHTIVEPLYSFIGHDIDRATKNNFLYELFNMALRHNISNDKIKLIIDDLMVHKVF